MLLVYAFLVVLVGLLLAQFGVDLHVARLRKQGLYPKKGEESIDDVKRMAQGGRQRLAVRCYRALHNTSLKEARQAVLKLG